jgi:acyl carrier protein phosphodiesterase
MNYLAHLYLADGTPDSLLGSLMGDFVRGRDLDRFSEELRRGIVLHRKVDAYTDAHEIVRRSKARISPANRRYAGMIVDVFYDHFLAAHWSDYAPVPLPGFAAEVYGVLQEREELLPDRLRSIAPHMIRQDWLCSYATLEGTQTALRRMARRVQRENSLEHAGAELAAQYQAFRTDFLEFFPDLARFARSVTEER